MKLPRKLRSEPLVEAVFEVRFQSNAPASSIFPGLLFSRLSGEKSFRKQPAADIPEAIRHSDINLLYAPLVGVVWQNYMIMVGDRTFGVSCKLPYPGWTKFKRDILEVQNIINTAGVLTHIERCSLKYTNIISAGLGKTPDVIALRLELGRQSVGNQPLQIRCEIFENELVQIVQVASEGSMVVSEGTTRTGVVIDIDTVRNLGISPSDFAERLPHLLDDTHQKLKSVFFSCLTEKALANFEPTYE